MEVLNDLQILFCSSPCTKIIALTKIIASSKAEVTEEVGGFGASGEWSGEISGKKKGTKERKGRKKSCSVDCSGQLGSPGKCASSTSPESLGIRQF